MNIKKFLKVFCPLLLVIVIIAGVTAVSYPEVYSSSSKKDMTEEELEDATGTYNVLLIGRDRGGRLTDTIMFVRIDNDRKDVNILSIPRDTYVDGWKINAMYSIGGIEETIDCVEDIVGLDVDYYVSITTDVFKEIIDQLDGVRFYVPQNMDYEDPYQDLYIHLTEGEQLLDGNKAEQLVRFRSYVQGDLQRTQVQRDFIQAAISQKKSLKYINRIDDIYKSIADDIETNLTLDDILSNIITFKNLDVTNNLNAYIMPNDPQNVGGISYVFVLDNELRELLTTKFGVDEDEIQPRSGNHVYTVSGGFSENYTQADDESAWFEPEVPEDYFDETEGDETENGETVGDTGTGTDVSDDVISGEQPEDTVTGEDNGADTTVVPENPAPEASAPAEDTNIYEEYPDAAGVPLD